MTKAVFIVIALAFLIIYGLIDTRLARKTMERRMSALYEEAEAFRRGLIAGFLAGESETDLIDGGKETTQNADIGPGGHREEEE